MRLISIKCPECSANLDIEEGRKHFYCTYCGAEIAVENENEQVYRTIDEARLKEVESKERVRLKELELEEYKIKKAEKKTKIIILAILAVAILGVILAVIGVQTKDKDLEMWGAVILFCIFVGGMCFFMAKLKNIMDKK